MEFSAVKLIFAFNIIIIGCFHDFRDHDVVVNCSYLVHHVRGRECRRRLVLLQILRFIFAFSFYICNVFFMENWWQEIKGGVVSNHRVSTIIFGLLVGGSRSTSFTPGVEEVVIMGTMYGAYYWIEEFRSTNCSVLSYYHSYVCFVISSSIRLVYYISFAISMYKNRYEKGNI